MDDAKRTRRVALLGARAGRPSPGDDRALADQVCALPELTPAATVAAYASRGTEPPTAVLVERLRAAGVTVLVPVLAPDRDLDWAVCGDTGRLGREAIVTADLVVVPALAVDVLGVRLGRGGGSYDRALRRVPVGVLVVALVYDDEYVDALPAAPHDRPVHAVITPYRTIRLH